MFFYESIEQKVAYEFSGLLGDIGGNMGLFIGASILTVIELFDFLYELMKERCVMLKNRLCPSFHPLDSLLSSLRFNK